MIDPSVGGSSTPTGYEYLSPTAQSSKGIMWARIAVTLVLIPLGWNAFHDEYGAIPLISGIDLAIHEFGHNLFMPFGWAFLGDTMVVAGGSITQVLFPTLFVGYFLFNRKHRDLHAATVCAWWVAMNILGVAIYAGDARIRKLMLISGVTGQEDDGHDFYQLFSRWGVLNRDTIYAERLKLLAGAMFFFSITLGLWTAIMIKPKPVVRAEE